MKKEITELGKELRKLRIELGENLLTMSGTLGVSSAFLSAIEVGRKNPPEGISRKVAEAYGLDEVTTHRLMNAEDASRRSFVLQPKTTDARQTIALLARSLDNLSGPELQRIRDIAEKKRTEDT